MRPHQGWCRIQACLLPLAILVVAGAGFAWAEQAPPPPRPTAPPESEPPGIVVEMGPAEPRSPAPPVPGPARVAPAPPGAASSPGVGALAGEVRALRERVEALERTLTGLLEALPVVASGVMAVPPAGRQLADPVANPLGFARLQPGQATVRHGLGAAEVTVHLAVVSPEGRVSYQVPAGGLFAAAPAPPDGTFTVFNATESPLAVRWWAILHAAPGESAPTPGTP